MKRFLLKLLSFVIPLLFVIYLLDLFLTSTLKRFKRGEVATWNEIFQGKIKADIFIYGSSRAFVQFDPSILEDSLHTSVYNLGMDGYNFDMQYCRHQILFEYNPKPKVILLSLGFSELYKRPDLYKQEQLIPYIRVPYIQEATKSYKGFDFYDYYLPYVRYFGRQNTILSVFNLLLKPEFNYTDRYKGFKPQDRKWKEVHEGEANLETAFSLKIDTPTLIKFKAFLIEMKEKNIQLIFVYSPEYIEGQRLELNRTQVLHTYQKFSKEYNIPFLDYSNSKISHEKKYFYNTMHLNKDGAELFTKQLATDLKMLIKPYE